MSFRGRNPPASLKPCPCTDDRQNAPTCFRGRNPPASLKHRGAPADSGYMVHCFRGRNPPASLKRRRLRRHTRRRARVSGGEIPRPH